MPIQAKDFLDLALKTIKQKNLKEVDLRNAISLSYYAVYHLCLTKVQVAKYPKMGVHMRLIKSMLDDKNKEIKKLGERLKRCKDQRIDADYELENTISLNKTKLTIMSAEILFKDTGQL